MRFTICLAITAFLVALLAGSGLVISTFLAAAPLAFVAVLRARLEPRPVRLRSRR